MLRVELLMPSCYPTPYLQFLYLIKTVFPQIKRIMYLPFASPCAGGHSVGSANQMSPAVFRTSCPPLRTPGPNPRAPRLLSRHLSCGSFSKAPVLTEVHSNRAIPNTRKTSRPRNNAPPMVKFQAL